MNPISAADYNKATSRIQEAIREQEEKLEELSKFSEENRGILKLVEDLPNNVSYSIMVPFGKSAFFPGKLVHTNEMTVLLGESYYAERSAKQTLEILSRRSQFLDMKMQNVNRQIADLQAEVSFARNAAEEAAEGVVEIVEEYVEPTEEEKRAVEAERSLERKRDAARVEDDDGGGFMARIEQYFLAEEEETVAQQRKNARDQLQVGTSEARAQAGSTSSSADLLHFDDNDQRWNITEKDKTKKQRNSLIIEEVEPSVNFPSTGD